MANPRYATLARVAGVELNTTERESLDGIDLWPAISNPQQVATNRSEIVLGLDGATVPPSGAYIREDLKLIVGGPRGEFPNCWYGTTSPNGTMYCDVGVELSCYPTPCLFNLSADPTEHHDIGKEKPDLFKDMRARCENVRGSGFHVS